MRYLVVLLLVAATPSFVTANRSYDTHEYYVLEQDPAASISHEDIVSELGADVVEKVGNLPHHYLVRRAKGTQDEDPMLQNLHTIRRRASQPHFANRFWNRDIHHARQIASSVRSVTRQVPRQRVKRWLSEPDPQLLETRSPDARFDEVTNSLGLYDPGFSKQWHLLNEQTPPHDMNVTGVWEMGYTGRGVISAIVDDGLDMMSEDLAANYVRLEALLRWWWFRNHSFCFHSFLVGRRLLRLQRPRRLPRPQTFR